jgi:hypothetical protein
LVDEQLDGAVYARHTQHVAGMQQAAVTTFIQSMADTSLIDQAKHTKLI